MGFRGVIVFIAIGLLIACGEGKVSDNKKATLTFLSSNVDQFSNGVPPTIDKIEIQVQEDLNPATVNNQTVHLMVGKSDAHTHLALDRSENDNNLSPIENTSPSDEAPTPTPFDNTDLLGVNDTIDGLVWFDQATKTIVFDPRRPLSPGETYHIRIHNVQLTDGTDITVTPNLNGTENGVVQFDFSTTHDHEVVRIRYDKEGNESAYITYRVVDNILKERKQFNKQKELQLTLLYNEPLPPPSTRVASRIYKNELGAITRYDYDVTNNDGSIASLRVKESGPDQVWGTDDDLLISWIHSKQEHLAHQITKTYTLTKKSELMPWRGTTSPGFEVRSIYLEEHAGPNFEHRDVFYRSLGTNGEIDIDPVTQDLIVIDDNVSLWHKRDFINGKRVRSWSIKGVDGGKGNDATLFTNDDMATGLSTMEYYPEDGSPTAGRLKKLVTYYRSDFLHPMNSWLISDLDNTVRTDAPVHSYLIFNYDNFGNKIEELRYSPGADKIMASEAERLSGISDDYITQRKQYSTQPTITGGLELGLN